MSLSRSRIQHDSRRIAPLSAHLQKHMALYGYEMVETPIIDDADLFLTKAGDQIITRLFTFERHGQALALRPEFTAPAAYRYVTLNAAETPVERWQFSGTIFEDDPTDLTRHYQRHSIGAELIGMDGTAADAEIISMAAQGVASLGIADWRLVIGHVGLMRRSLSQFQLDSRSERFLLNNRGQLKAGQNGKEALLKRLDQYLFVDTDSADVLTRFNKLGDGNTLGGRSEQDILRRLSDKQKRATQRDQIMTAIDFLQNWAAIHGPSDTTFDILQPLIGGDSVTLLNEWREVLALLRVYDIPAERIIIQPDLARNWDYYTGIVFELHTDDGLHIGGGGRYDELTRLIGGDRAVPAVGFAYYVDSLLEALPSVSTPSQCALVIVGDDPQAAVRWAQQLRQRGITATIVTNPYPVPPTIRVDTANNAHYREKSYSLTEIDALITAWEQ